MSPNFDFEVPYGDSPVVSLRVIAHETRREHTIEALIDTGSDITIFDAAVANDLGIDLRDRPLVRFQGIGDRIREAPTADLELLPLFESDLSVVLPVAFVPGLLASVGNLIGRDVLEYLDFGLSHSERLLYLGRAPF